MIWLDTQALIFARDGRFRPDSDDIAEHVKRARKFVGDRRRKGERVYLSALVVAEYLTKAADDKQRDDLLRTLQERFVVKPFSMKAARLVAELRAEKAKIVAAKAESQRSTDCIKADLVIYGTAVAYGAKRLISYDPGVQALGKMFNMVEVGPFEGAQSEMFASEDS